MEKLITVCNSNVLKLGFRFDLQNFKNYYRICLELRTDNLHCSNNIIYGMKEIRSIFCMAISDLLQSLICFYLPSCFHSSRATEKEKMMVEEETQKRVEELVANRVEEQLAKRKDEIDAEVMKRVEEAKTVMEKQMVEEFEKRQQEQLEEQQMKEVNDIH